MKLTPYAKAWMKFEQSSEFKTAADLSTIGGDSAQQRYQENRLKGAFDAGWNAKTSMILDSLSRTLKELSEE